MLGAAGLLTLVTLFGLVAAAWLAANKATAPRDYGAITPPDLIASAKEWQKRIFDNSKVSDHFAIIPTMQAPRSLTDGPISLTWEDTNGQPGKIGACLTAYSGGPMADLAAAWSSDDRQEKYLAVLEQLYPGFGEQFEKSLFVNWHNDPWARGSYSFPAPGQVTTIGPLLDAGLGRLQFAGEHCCPAFIGYMEGALQSGVRVARRMAKRDGLIS